MISYHGVSIILSRTIAIIDTLINALMHDFVFLSTVLLWLRFLSFLEPNIFLRGPMQGSLIKLKGMLVFFKWFYAKFIKVYRRRSTCANCSLGCLIIWTTSAYNDMTFSGGIKVILGFKST